MNGFCGEFERALESGGAGADDESRWQQHLAGCVDCREQLFSDAALREMELPLPPKLRSDFDRRLHRRLEKRSGGRSLTATSPGKLVPSAWWTLGAYGTAAAFASVMILSRLPWQSLTASPGLGIAFGVVALLSPLVLLDRRGIVRPPG